MKPSRSGARLAALYLIAALLVASGLARTRKLYAPDGSPLTQAQSEARNPLNQGVAAFKNGQ